MAHAALYAYQVSWRLVCFEVDGNTQQDDLISLSSFVLIMEVDLKIINIVINLF
jgi:hypothetical protein